MRLFGKILNYSKKRITNFLNEQNIIENFSSGRMLKVKLYCNECGHEGFSIYGSQEKKIHL